METATKIILLLILAAIVAFIVNYVYKNNILTDVSSLPFRERARIDTVGYCGKEPGTRGIGCYNNLWKVHGACNMQEMTEHYGSPEYTWTQQKEWLDKQSLEKIKDDMADPLNCTQKRLHHS